MILNDTIYKDSDCIVAPTTIVHIEIVIEQKNLFNKKRNETNF